MPQTTEKPRLELLPFGALTDIADVLAFGARKYGADNWRRGASWSRYFAVCLRHLFAWWRGEGKDPETGLSHLAHAGCCILFLIEYERDGMGEDDRPDNQPDDVPFVKHDGR